MNQEQILAQSLSMTRTVPYFISFVLINLTCACQDSLSLINGPREPSDFSPTGTESLNTGGDSHTGGGNLESENLGEGSNETESGGGSMGGGSVKSVV